MVIVQSKILKRELSPDLMNGLQRISGIEIAERRYRQDPGLGLLPMIQTARDSKTVDDREYIFAMLPITRQSTGGLKKEMLPTVDYTKTTEEVFIEAAACIIRERQDVFLWWT